MEKVLESQGINFPNILKAVLGWFEGIFRAEQTQIVGLSSDISASADQIKPASASSGSNNRVWPKHNAIWRALFILRKPRSSRNACKQAKANLFAIGVYRRSRQSLVLIRKALQRINFFAGLLRLFTLPSLSISYASTKTVLIKYTLRRGAELGGK